MDSINRDLIDKAIQQREKFVKLIGIAKTGYAERIGAYIDALDEETAKSIIRRFVYGGWKDMSEEKEVD
jgi:hypothetical protein